MRSGAARAGVALVAASSIALGVGLTATQASANSVRPQQSGGTATYALPSAVGGMYIFPMEGPQFFSVPNQQYFTWLMYRPLYWFANGSQVILNAGQSLAQPPVYSNGFRTVTINMKGWKWSNGETIDAQDVLFWVNMQKSVDGIGGYGGYVPGTFPDDVTSLSASGNTVTMHLSGGVNPNWFTYNGLSEITPMPIAWDVTSTSGKPGSGGCSSAPFSSITVDSKGKPSSASAKACEAVYNFLSTQSGYNPVNSSTTGSASANWPTSPIWSIVSGPWKLQSYSSTGNIVYVPNPSYSGYPKPKLSQFIEQNFTSNSAEFSSLLSGSTDYGFLPAEDVKTPAVNPTTPGPNFPALAGNYQLAPWASWETHYWVMNENANGVAGPELKQPYIRQAMVSLINQPLLLKTIYKGYGVVDDGPVPLYPPTPYSAAERNDPWPYSPSTARKLLTSHGWTINAGGTDVCGASGGCGAGIPKGSPLSFNMVAEAGSTSFTQRVVAETESWGSLGIHVNVKYEAFSVIISSTAVCKRGTPACAWQLGAYGGWLYAPDYYPTGEDIFQTGAISNNGGYSNGIADALIKATDFQSGAQFFDKYVRFITVQSPVLWQPGTYQQLSEIRNNLHGVLPQNPLLALTPETWSKS
jgi:peptide/nickel transport system substrate-binding protein